MVDFSPLLAKFRIDSPTGPLKSTAKPTVSALPQTEELCRHIEALLCVKAGLEDIARHSYLHDNGFCKLVLARDDATGAALRIHYWTRKAISDISIHNHAWDFASRIILGEMINEIYSATDGGMSWHKYSCPTLAARCTAMVALGQERLGLSSRRCLNAGEEYSMLASELHRAYPKTDRAITLVLQGGHVQDHSQVWYSAPLPPKDSSEVTRLDTKTIRRVLEDFLRAATSRNLP